MSASGISHVAVKILKTLGWTLLAIVVAVSVLLFCAVKFIDSKYLAPLVERVADDYIDGHVKVGSVRLGFHPSFPVLGVEVKDLTVVSHAFDSLTPEQRGLLPDYADSLLTLDYMTGSLDIKRLLADNELSMHNVVLRGLGVNLVIARDGKANYEIVKTQTTDTVSSSNSTMPAFRIDRFSLESPREIRFYNASDSTSASVLLLTDAAVDGHRQPMYRLKINGNVTSPKAALITNLDRIDFGVNGKVYWNPASPGLVAMDEMELRGAFVKATVSGEIDLENSPIVRRGVVDLEPVAVTDLLRLLPDSLLRAHRLHAPYFSTDAVIGGRFELLRPMNLASDTIPAARIKLNIPSSTVRYGEARFKELALDATINTVTNLPDSTVVDVERLVVAGPATRLEVSALLGTLLSDPQFDTDVKGQIDLVNFPPVIRDMIPGYLSGLVTADLHAAGRASMLGQQHLHRLVADGEVTARDVYFLSSDTDKMVELGNVRINFDSRKLIGETPVLSTRLEVDTATILAGGVDIAVGALSLAAGVENKGNHMDTTRVVPFGGNLKVGRLNIVSITDSAGGRIRNLDGHVLLRRFKGHDRIPEIIADLSIGRASAGSRSDRIVINNAALKASLHKLPSRAGRRRGNRRDTRRDAENAYIAPDSVFRMAYERRHHKPGEKRTRRVYGSVSADDNEILEWNLTKGFNRFLNEWRLEGSLTTRHARLLTPLFPLRNRFSRLDVRFNNDTVDVSNISLRAGRSDVSISGLVTNVRRALTSKTHDTLKVNFSLLSDTIDINELSFGAFTGASYAESRRLGKVREMQADDDDALESHLDSLAKNGPAKASPLLIPVNIDANLKIGADNVLYGDLALKDMGGDLLVYDGGVNLHRMKADSDAGNLTLSALYSAPSAADMRFGFGMELQDFNIAKFVDLVPAVDSIVPLIHDFSGMIGADIAATCRIDSGMNLMLPTLDAAIRISGDNLAFIDPVKYRTLGKWLGFKNKTDNTIRQMNVEMTVAEGLMRVYPFAFNIDRYRLGVSGSNDMAMNFDYHISVLKSPLPFKFGITISGNPDKYKVRFGGAKFKENTAVESVSVVNDARINLVDQIENVFRRGVRNSRFATLQVARPGGYDATDQGLTAADSLQLIKEGIIEPPAPVKAPDTTPVKKKKRKRFLFF